jgi:hypothetical protein
MATRFPSGVYSYGVPLLPTAGGVITGNVFFVGSAATYNADAPGYGTKDKPFATIDYAIGKCTASNGDVIYVLPGHTEAVAAAGGIAVDVAGISILGLGKGSLRPTVTLATATTASITVSAANCTIDNILFVANLDNMATCFTISGKDCTISNSEFRDTSSALHFYSCILTSATNNEADGLQVLNCKRTALATGSLAFISVLGNNDRCNFSGNNIYTAATGDVGHFVIMSSKVMLSTLMLDNTLAAPDLASAAVGQFMTGSSTTSTGIVARNYVASTDTSAALFCTATLTFGLFENYQTGVLANSGLLWPAADTPS